MLLSGLYRKGKNVFSKNGLFWLINYFMIAISSWKVFPIKWQLKIKYRCTIGEPLNLICPKGFNEKLSWIKIYDHNPLYTKLVDKFEVKNYVAKLIGEEYVVPCYGVWNSFDDIDFDKLPNQFVLKATHDSSGIVICKDKNVFDMKSAKIVIDNSLKTDYFLKGFEWPYKDVPRRVLADMFLTDNSRVELQDYKWWCFGGEPKVMYITNKGKYQQCEENFYDMDFVPLDINHGFPRTKPEYKKPAQFEKMKELASVLSQGMRFVRVDFFVVSGKIYFGEFTFFDHAGLRPFANNGWDEKLGSWIEL